MKYTKTIFHNIQGFYRVQVDDYILPILLPPHSTISKTKLRKTSSLIEYKTDVLLILLEVIKEVQVFTSASIEEVTEDHTACIERCRNQSETARWKRMEVTDNLRKLVCNSGPALLYSTLLIGPTNRKDATVDGKSNLLLADPEMYSSSCILPVEYIQYQDYVVLAIAGYICTYYTRLRQVIKGMARIPMWQGGSIFLDPITNTKEVKGNIGRAIITTIQAYLDPTKVIAPPLKLLSDNRRERELASYIIRSNKWAS